MILLYFSLELSFFFFYCSHKASVMQKFQVFSSICRNPFPSQPFLVIRNIQLLLIQFFPLSMKTPPSHLLFHAHTDIGFCIWTDLRSFPPPPFPKLIMLGLESKLQLQFEKQDLWLSVEVSIFCSDFRLFILLLNSVT